MDVEGNLYPCHRWKEPNVKNKFCFGNISDPFFKNDLRQQFLDFQMSHHISAECDKCKALSICTSICLAACAAENNGDEKTPHTIHCQLMRILWDAAETAIFAAERKGITVLLSESVQNTDLG